jgi:hypothetical protein
MSSDISSPERVTVRIPTPAGDEIDAWLYLPEGDGPHPAVVMAHGFAAVKAGGYNRSPSGSRERVLPRSCWITASGVARMASLATLSRSRASARITAARSAGRSSTP